jgi:hypothetical protein
VQYLRGLLSQFYFKFHLAFTTRGQFGHQATGSLQIVCGKRRHTADTASQDSVEPCPRHRFRSASILASIVSGHTRPTFA